jgi:DNA/RNA endonuclease YhcR with UshA esterase domain
MNNKIIVDICQLLFKSLIIFIFMKKVTFILIFIVMSIFTFSIQAQTVFINEQFDYPAGDSLTIHNWAAHSGTGTNTVLVKSGSLSYNQYPASNGNSVFLKNTGQDINRTFSGQNSGTVYLSALVKVDSASASTGEYFMHFLRNATNFVGRVYVKKSTTNPALISFGLLKGNTAGNTVYTSATYSIDSTYLLVVRYKFVSGTANDSVSLFINPVFGNEGIPTIKATDMASTDLDSAYSVALRQGTAGNNNYINVDEIRVTNTWFNAVGYYTTPVVTTSSVSNITTTSATCGGNLITNGGLITTRGICYDTIPNPTLANLFTIEPGNLGPFSSNLSGLILGKSYYYRAFATNSAGTVYGVDSMFTTSSTAVLPIVTTNAVSDLNHLSATISGEIINDGGSAIISRGFCWSTTTNPSLTDSVIIIPGTTTGTFNSGLTNLIANTTYNVRTFATNSIGTNYGNNISFKTLVFVPTYTIEQIHTNNPTTGVADSLNVNCKLYGVVHGLNYVTAGYSFYIMNSNSGIFVYKTTSLGYTVAEGDSLKVIGKIQQYSGLTAIAPDSIVKISSGNTLVNPVLVNNLSDTVESRLVTITNLTYLSGWPTTVGTTKTVYALHGIDSVAIVIFSSCNLQGTAAPTASFNITGITTQSDNSSPFFQSYYIYPRYLSDLTINFVLPTVLTSSVTTVSMTGANCSGNVTANGGSSVIVRGICYGTSLNPDTSGTHTVETGGNGVFSSTISGLLSSTLYHYRAYAINNTGIAYGDDSTFTTASSPLLPLVNTDSVYNVNYFDAMAASKVINDGGATITSRGICWGTVSNPTLSDSVNYQTGTLGSFVSNLTNLTHNTTYYIRAFATNSIGTAYSNELTFTTKKNIPIYSINQVKGNNSLGVADSVNVNCKLTGIVHGLNYLASTNPNGLSFFMIDSTAGINVYKTSNLGYTVTEGDKIKVIGKIAQVNGLTEIVPDSIVLISSGNTLFNTLTVNTPTNDSLESKLVKIENLFYLSGWPTTAGTTKTVLTLKGQDTVTLRIFNNCNLQGMPAPTATVSFSITGLVNQNDASSPFTAGYQILPRNTSDLVINYSNPTVITGTSAGITQYTALCSGSIPSDGGYVVTSRGICYDTVADPTTADSIRTSTGTTGNFTVNLTNLTMSTTYHYRAFVVNSLGTFYGNDSVFTTAASAVVPVITTTNASAIGFTNATVGGVIVNDGGDTIITKGICWSMNQNPTVADSISIVSGSATTYSSIINNLTENTIYYARAYAANAIGIGYGNQIIFITKRLPSSYTISQVKGVNSNGVTDSLIVNCKLTGVVHGINFKQTLTFNGLNFFMLDATAGINVYKTTNLGYVPVEGDLIRVIGKITQLSGLTEIVPDSIVVISSANPLNTPITITSLNENLESQLVRMENLEYISGWPTFAGFTTSSVLALNGLDTVTLRLYTNCNLQSMTAPTGTFNITGIVSQIDASSPFLSGYVIVPRDSNDLLITTAIKENTISTFKLYPNPANGKVNITIENAFDAEIRIYSLVGKLIYKQEATQSFNSIDVSKYGKGIYFVNILNKSNGKSFIEKLIIQ